MKNKKYTEGQNLSRELHSNLMLATTIIAMLGFVVLMLIYMGMRNPSVMSLATGAARFGGIAAWFAAALLAFNSVKKQKKYFLEYIIYLIIMGFGLTFMFNAPFSMNFMYKHNITNWARNSVIALVALSGVFFVASIAFHGVLASVRKKK